VDGTEKGERQNQDKKRGQRKRSLRIFFEEKPHERKIRHKEKRVQIDEVLDFTAEISHLRKQNYFLNGWKVSKVLKVKKINEQQKGEHRVKKPVPSLENQKQQHQPSRGTENNGNTERTQSRYVEKNDLCCQKNYQKIVAHFILLSM
jgi:hypothetical protein